LIRKYYVWLSVLYNRLVGGFMSSDGFALHPIEVFALIFFHNLTQT
jgi:hypothetical protein